MSRYELRLLAYDVMDRVHVGVTLRDMENSTDHEAEWIPLVSTSIQGVGETDRRAWVQDALVAALERL